ncbi:MAG: signal peptidase II [Candidatus Sulfotelmatobacter sp.]|jgi:signal peptidase II
MKMEEESKKNEVAEAESSGPLPEQVKIFAGTIGMTKNSARAIYLLIVLIVVLLDRWTKHLVAQRIRLYSHIQVIPGFFRLTHTENTGAAFSLFADSTAPWKTGLLIAFSVIALIVVSALLWKNHQAQVATGVGLSLIMGGALGNLWDRLARGRVVDFLLVYVKQYQWPVFNLADSAIVIGAGLLILEILLHKSGGQGESQPN